MYAPADDYSISNRLINILLAIELLYSNFG